ncbi:MAG: zinc finger domain-containing protein, partial [Propionibacteriaceae bacterium]|nr:zinc finger domain-containing protein [Propionibacteriaceae bacterium]
LGPDPLAADFTAADLLAILTTAGRAQLKGVLRDQKILAGIGNAYSDEILHAAKLSPFKPANSLDDDAVDHLFTHIRQVLGEALASAAGKEPAELKDAKRAGMRVHGRTGEPCVVCGDTIAEVSFADSSLQYCPGCQTGGKPLADRRMSRLLK